MTHTPGPWKMNTNVQTSIDAKTKHIAMVNYYKSGRARDDVYGEEHEANARLIAAAPELLAALVAARQEIADSLYEAEESFNDARTIDYLKRLLEKADKAIAKAEGAE